MIPKLYTTHLTSPNHHIQTRNLGFLIHRNSKSRLLVLIKSPPPKRHPQKQTQQKKTILMTPRRKKNPFHFANKPPQRLICDNNARLPWPSEPTQFRIHSLKNTSSIIKAEIAINTDTERHCSVLVMATVGIFIVSAAIILKGCSFLCVANRKVSFLQTPLVRF